MTTEIAPTGSRWYAWGHHYEVVEQTTWDDEQAVVVRNVDKGRAPKVLRIPFSSRRLEKFGRRTDLMEG